MNFFRTALLIITLSPLVGCMNTIPHYSTGFNTDVELSQHRRLKQNKAILIEAVDLPADVMLTDDLKEIISEEIQLSMLRVVNDWPGIESVDLIRQPSTHYDASIKLSFDQYGEKYSKNNLGNALLAIVTLTLSTTFESQKLECNYSATSEVKKSNGKNSTITSAESAGKDKVSPNFNFSIGQNEEEKDPCYQARNRMMSKVLNHLATQLYGS